MTKLFDNLKQADYIDSQLGEIFNKPAGKGAFYLEGEVKPKLKTLIFEISHHCATCGEAKSADCFTCERLWSS